MADLVRLPGGQEVDIDRYGDYPLWSTWHGIISGVVNKIICFNYIQGDNIIAGRVADQLDTNLMTSKQGVGYTEEMLVLGIAIQLPHKVAKAQTNPDIGLLLDIIEMVDKTYFHFDVNQKVYAEGTLDAFPFFGGLHVVSNLNQAEYVNNGEPSSSSAKPLALPIKITGADSFKATIEFPKGALTLNNAGTVADNQDYKIRCWLLGIRSRYEGKAKVSA